MKMNAGTLQDYLVATIENAQDHATEPPQLMFLVDQMDEIFQQEIFAQEYEASAFAALLAMNAYTLLLSAVRQALSGHVVYGGEVVTYAAKPEPDRKQWRKRPSLLDEAFQEEVKKEERRQAKLHQK
jgi:hypothetical protein